MGRETSPTKMKEHLQKEREERSRKKRRSKKCVEDTNKNRTDDYYTEKG